MFATKKCTKCGVLRPLSDYHKDSGTKDGRKYACKVCTIKQVSQHRLKNYGVIRARNQQVYRKNRDKMIEKSKEWASQNPEKRVLSRISYSASTRGRAVQLWNRVKRRHKGSRDTLVSLDQIEAALERGICEVTGIPFVLERCDEYTRHPYGPSVDKTDPKSDYTSDNIKVVCNMYNFGKNEYTYDKFLEFCRAFVAHADGVTGQ